MDIQNAARNAEKIVSAEDKEFSRRIANQERNLRRALDGEQLSTTETTALLQYLADTNRVYEQFFFAESHELHSFTTQIQEAAERGEIDIPDYAA